MVVAHASERLEVAQHGKRLEYFTIVWNTLEGLIAAIAGMIAGSVSLVGFGADSFIEAKCGAALLWRLPVDAGDHGRENKEQTALRVVGACFLALAAYLAYESAHE